MLRIALLTTIETADGDPTKPRGFLKIGAGTVARHQLTLALALECQLVVCLARALTPELIDLQHGTEKAGARFQFAAGARALASLVTANDEVLVVGDGLLAEPRTARALLEAGPAVLVQPVESGTAAGFERVDINHAAAGLMRIPGRLVERLNELPPDCDVASALTRIALQSGVATRELPSEAREGFNWVLVRNEVEAQRIETGWIALQVSYDGTLTAGTFLARLGVKAAGPALLHAGSGGNAMAVGALVVALLGLGAGWGGFVGSALGFCAVAWVLRRTAGLLLRIERETLGLPPDRWSREAVFGWLLDAVLIAILAWSPQNEIWADIVQRVFAPLMLICVVRLVARVHQGRGAAWIEDRAILAIVLAVASVSGVLLPAVHMLAAVLAFLGIVLRSLPQSANASLTIRR